MVSQESKTSPYGREARRVERRKGRKAAPALDSLSLRDLALAYVARFATTAAKVEAYLARKIRERGVAQDEDGRDVDLDVAGLVTRLVELGYIDDAAYARSRSRDLTERGYGTRRVEQALWSAGVEEQVRAQNSPSEAAGRRAAIRYASKRGFGPFARGECDPDEPIETSRKRREKQVAAMLRAGHLYEHIQTILEAAQAAELEEWAIEAEERDDDV